MSYIIVITVRSLGDEKKKFKSFFRLRLKDFPLLSPLVVVITIHFSLENRKIFLNEGLCSLM